MDYTPKYAKKSVVFSHLGWAGYKLLHLAHIPKISHLSATAIHDKADTTFIARSLDCYDAAINP